LMLNGYIASIGGGDDDNAQSIIDDLLGATITRSQEVLSDRYIDPRLDLCRQYVDKGQRHTAQRCVSRSPVDRQLRYFRPIHPNDDSMDLRLQSF